LHTDSNHSFVICAYRESPFLKECIQSLLRQTVKSKVLLVTSTPNQYISNIAKNFDIEYVINDGEKGMVQDWNYAYRQAKTKYVTLAHQDDVYSNNYTEEIVKEMKRAKNPLIAFTDYNEIRNDKIIKKNTMLQVKRIMLLPLKFRVLYKSRFVRRRILSFGCPICCPSVTYIKSNAGENFFDNKYINSCDYKTWVNLSNKKGAFIYTSKQLLGHRIYSESSTSLNITANIRQKEDLEILCEFWPKPIARLINKLYSTSENSNKL